MIDEELLKSYFETARSKDFSWGVFDCINFVNGWVAYSNFDLAERVKEKLGNYETKEQAMKIFNKYKIKDNEDYVRELENVGFYEVVSPETGILCLCYDKILGIVDFDYSVVVLTSNGITKKVPNGDVRYLSWQR